MADQSEHKAPTLADRMKSYEAEFDFTLPSNAPIIIRLDGHGFSRFTAHFCRPFDQRIHDAMVSTCTDLLKYFQQATLAYTQSDEITLVFPAGVQSFNERVQKLGSLAASYCSVRFGDHLRKLLAANPEPQVKESAHDAIASAHFDARIFAVPSVEEALNCVLWRCRGDAMRNSVSGFARTLLSDKQIHGRTRLEVIEILKNEKGVVYEDAVPKWAVEGSLVKREQVQHEGTNLKTGEPVVALRTKIRVEDRGITEFSEENLRLVVDKFW
ncbi:Thg1-domain-containing protein [Aaosphaeria arxii CBS 175.79]|uniref:tRNA(His) guanylyltransferase n=1 Tax=Aaosphaeria arxii CBS 175.79 TaxID=1450172 RepID=A0A6A5Y5L6_9PLEO|nr:Thg1-domain-containing protein [Aaosphaeria arxii CBS 175.79]KAF2020845.1 Thg1-domain-containing protein [Aaosphaeria arxii CBS 175.79]